MQILLRNRNRDQKQIVGLSSFFFFFFFGRIREAAFKDIYSGSILSIDGNTRYFNDIVYKNRKRNRSYLLARARCIKYSSNFSFFMSRISHWQHSRSACHLTVQKSTLLNYPCMRAELFCISAEFDCESYNFRY